MNQSFVTHCRIGALIGVSMGVYSAYVHHLSMLVWPVLFGLVGVVVAGAVGGACYINGGRYGSVSMGAGVGGLTAYVVGYICLLSSYNMTGLTSCSDPGFAYLFCAIVPAILGAFIGAFVDAAGSQQA